MAKILVLDSWYSQWSADTVPGGAEKAALSCSQALGADMFTPETSDGCDRIKGVQLVFSSVPPRKRWPVDTASVSRKYAGIREAEIESLVCREGYDVVVNNSSSGSHVAALRRLRQLHGVAVVNFCHLSFAVGSFPRFGLIQELHRLRRAGGFNVTTAESMNDQVAELIGKKAPGVIKVDPDQVQTPFFDFILHPSHLDHVPPYVDLPREGVFALTRFSEDKNVKDLVRLLLKFRSMGVKAEAHFATGSDPAGLWEATKTLKSAGVEVQIDAPQTYSLLRARSFALHLTASHTECFGIVPCEMAAIGLPTAYVEKGKPHVLRTVLPAYSEPIDVKGSDAQQVYLRAAEMSEKIRRDMSEWTRAIYSKASFDAGIRSIVEKAAKTRVEGSIF